MDYEKKYKEALKKAEAFYNSATTEPITEREVLANIFPELKESEDEKVRKTLIRVLNENIGNGIEKYGAKLEDAIAWLEKQKDANALIQEASEKAYTEGMRVERKHWVEKQGKQKSVYKVEPKFKVGDRVNKNDRKDEEHCILTITSVNIGEHCYICDQCSVIDFGEQDLWHIVEQKPAWSEEDEEISKGILNYLCLHDACELEGFDSWYNWLKSSLKDRYTWKPSDEQMDALQYVFRNINPPLSDKLGWSSIKTLELLYHDLKKLREE